MLSLCGVPRVVSSGLAGVCKEGVVSLEQEEGGSGAGSAGPASLSSSSAGADAGEHGAPAAARVRSISSNKQWKFTGKPMPPRPAKRHGPGRARYCLQFL